MGVEGQGGCTVSNCLGTLQTLVTTRTERRLREVRFYGFTPPLPLPWATPFTRIPESTRRRYFITAPAPCTSQGLKGLPWFKWG